VQKELSDVFIGEFAAINGFSSGAESAEAETKELIKLRKRKIKLGNFMRMIHSKNYQTLINDSKRSFLKIIKGQSHARYSS